MPETLPPPDEKPPASLDAPPLPEAPDFPVDEELVALPKGRPPRSPLVALAVLAVAAILLYALLPDVRYALSSTTPIALGEARAVAPSALVDNRVASLGGPADYRNALLFEPKGDNYRRAFYRMLGTGSRLWVRAEQTQTRHDVSGLTVGRLRRFDALPYAQQIRRYYAEEVKVTRLLDLGVLQEALRAGAPRPLRDSAGEPVPWEEAAAGKLTLVHDFADELYVVISRERFAVAEDAAHELARLGQPVGPARTTKEAYELPVRLVVPAPPVGGQAPSLQQVRDAYIAKLEAHQYGYRLRRESFGAPLAGLKLDGEKLSFPTVEGQPEQYAVEGDRLVVRAPGPRTEVDFARIDSAQIASPITIPADAWVLIEADLPADYRYAPALAALLLVFAAFNVWLLIRSRRQG